MGKFWDIKPINVIIVKERCLATKLNKLNLGYPLYQKMSGRPKSDRQRFCVTGSMERAGYAGTLLTTPRSSAANCLQMLLYSFPPSLPIRP